jgi:DNA-binding NtrC family response regulator
MVPWARSERGWDDDRVRVLVLSQSTDDQDTLCRFLAAWNFDPVSVLSAEEGVALASQQGIGIAIVASPVAGTRGLTAVRALRQSASGIETILLAAEDSAEYATEAFRAGAYNCLLQPVDYRQLSQDLNTLREAVWRKQEGELWKAEWETEAGLGGMVGSSTAMQAAYSAIRRLARENSPVLFTGLIGTGKELAAQTLHLLSPRAGTPLVIYRCCGASEALAEKELFGAGAPCEREAEGSEEAIERVPGALESARGGTLLLDEIGDLPLGIQEKLEEALRGNGLPRAEGEEPTSAAVRVLAATRLNLTARVGRGAFREGLYRLLGRNVIHLPSLGERPEDIPLLCRHFLRQFNQEYSMAVGGFSSAAERTLLSYAWPGNVRELENVIGRACLLADGDRIEAKDLSIASSPGNGWSESLPNWDEWRKPSLAAKAASGAPSRKPLRADRKK